MESWNSGEQNKSTSSPLPHFTDEESRTQRQTNSKDLQPVSSAAEIRIWAPVLPAGLLQLLQTVSNQCFRAAPEVRQGECELSASRQVNLNGFKMIAESLLKQATDQIDHKADETGRETAHGFLSSQRSVQTYTRCFPDADVLIMDATEGSGTLSLQPTLFLNDNLKSPALQSLES